MPTFAYTARDRAGQLIRGVVTGVSSGQVREQLRQTDLFLTNIREQAGDTPTMTSGGLFRARRVRLNDMVIMSRQLATLIGAGMPLVVSSRIKEYKQLTEGDARLRLNGALLLQSLTRAEVQAYLQRVAPVHVTPRPRSPPGPRKSR